MEDKNALTLCENYTDKNSTGIGKLALALAKAQGQMCAAKKDNENPFFKSKYADLASIWDACRKPLSDNSLAVIQIAESQSDGTIAIKTILAHASGEFISSVLPINAVKRDPQGIGSAITYARRYALAAIVGVSPEDDDGEAAMGKEKNKIQEPQRKIEQQKPASNQPKTEDQFISDEEMKTITPAQVKLFHHVKNINEWKDEEVKAWLLSDFNFASSKGIMQDKFEAILTRLNCGEKWEG